MQTVMGDYHLASSDSMLRITYEWVQEIIASCNHSNNVLYLQKHVLQINETTSDVQDFNNAMNYYCK